MPERTPSPSSSVELVLDVDPSTSHPGFADGIAVSAK